jgi:hypothetical protein
MLHRRGDAGEILHRAQADVEVEHLAQGDIQRADAAADRRGERAFDAHQIFLERLDRVVRQPVVELVLGRLAGEHLEPGDLAFAAVGLLHRASNTRTLAAQMSGPVPSPRMNGSVMGHVFLIYGRVSAGLCVKTSPIAIISLGLSTSESFNGVCVLGRPPSPKLSSAFSSETTPPELYP